MGSIEKSLSRKLRRLYETRVQRSWNNNRDYTESVFEIGKFAAQLVPYWAETDHRDFELYLYHRCGFNFQAAGLISLWMHTYYEIPSLAVWLEVGYDKAAQAATRNQEGMQERLLAGGLNVLDLMTLVR